MRVCVIGTSNAIFKNGYCGGIENHQSVRKFAKYCIGATPSLIIPYFSEKISYADFDYVIFDTAVNDGNFIETNAIRKDQIRQFIEYGVSRAARDGCKSAFLIMPSLKKFLKPTIPRIIYSRIAAETGSVLLDGFDYAAELARDSGSALQDLFLDEFHLRKDLAWTLGEHLVDKLVAAAGSQPIEPSLKSRYYTLPLSDYAEYTERRTSLTTSRMVQLTTDAIHLPVTPGHEAAGVVYNAYKTSGSVQIGNSIVKSLWTKYFGSEKDLLTLMAPIVSKKPVGDDGILTIRLADPHAKLTETSRTGSPKSKSQEHAQVEVEAIIMRERLAQ